MGFWLALKRLLGIKDLESPIDPNVFDKDELTKNLDTFFQFLRYKRYDAYWESVSTSSWPILRERLDQHVGELDNLFKYLADVKRLSEAKDSVEQERKIALVMLDRLGKMNSTAELIIKDLSVYRDAYFKPLFVESRFAKDWKKETLRDYTNLDDDDRKKMLMASRFSEELESNYNTIETLIRALHELDEVCEDLNDGVEDSTKVMRENMRALVSNKEKSYLEIKELLDKSREFVLDEDEPLPERMKEQVGRLKALD